MPNYGAASIAPTVFRALADPTRCEVVRRLAGAPSSMTELARPFAMALPSFAQHMRVLEEQGIVRSAKVGRVRTYELDGVRLEPASDWLATVHDEWESRHDRLVDYVQRLGRDAG